MSILKDLSAIKSGATEVEMYNNARNRMTANYIGQLLDAGKGEQAQSVYYTTKHANKTVDSFNAQSKSANNG